MIRSWDLRLLLTAAAVLLTAWSFAVPIFEGPDEFLHWQYARHLREERRLPLYSATFAEGNSPPLYYAIIALVATRTATPPPVVWLDGLDQFQMSFLPTFHMTAADDLRHYWPIRWARLLTVLMSLATIAIGARIGYEATDRVSTALLAGGLTAFLPQFTFRGSHVSNDALVTTGAACVVWVMVRILRRGFTWRRGLVAATLLGATYLTKINAIALAPALALVLLTEPVSWRRRLQYLGVFGVTLAIVAPWSIRNVILYGDPFALGAMPAAVANLIQERSLGDTYFINQFPRELFKTFVGFFGHMSVKLPKPVYIAYLLFILIAAAGFVRRALQDRVTARLALVLAALILSALAIVIRINLQFNQPQGRYLFPAVPAIALMLAIGLEAWRPWSREREAEEEDPSTQPSPRTRGEGDEEQGRRLWPARATVIAWAAANALILALVLLPAYPPLVPRVSEALLAVSSLHTRDLAMVGTVAPGTYAIAGPRPELSSDIRVAADEARFVIVDVEGGAPDRVAGGRSDPELDGAILLTLADAAEARELRVPFRWRADGRRRTLYLSALLMHGWAGTVTRIRVLPVEQATAALQGLRLTVQNLRVAGSIPSHDF